ncbi:unnamed protein product [Ectocarpus sp. CCAP 1310/34]|nr:unnamed protein product [Ectocarpus sp. CCAP 1310/34]
MNVITGLGCLLPVHAVDGFFGVLVEEDGENVCLVYGINVHAVGRPPPWCLRFPLGVVRSGGVADHCHAQEWRLPLGVLGGSSSASAISILGGHLSM